MNLKDNIIEHFDFEAVSPAVWRLIYSWYSADWCIMRVLKRDRVNTKGVVLDLYPELTVPGQIIFDPLTEEDSYGTGPLNRTKSLTNQNRAEAEPTYDQVKQLAQRQWVSAVPKSKANAKSKPDS